MTSTTQDLKTGPNVESKVNTRIVLVRHGVTGTTGKVLPGRAAGLNLSTEGHQQAQAVAKRLADLEKVAALYSSPMERTLQTAAPMAEALNLGITVEEGLLECDFGTWTGRKIADLAKTPEWKTVQHEPSTFRFPEGESFTEMQSRIVNTLLRLAQQHQGETVVAVSHADPIKSAISHAAGAHLNHFQRFVVSPCSMSVLDINNDTFTILTVNSLENGLRHLAIS